MTGWLGRVGLGAGSVLAEGFQGGRHLQLDLATWIWICIAGGGA